MYENIKNIYDSLLDEESRMIFRYRLLYSLTGERRYIREWLAQYSKENKGYYDIYDVYKYPEILQNREIITFGTGIWSNVIRRLLFFCESSFDFFCDNNPNKIGKELLGKRIISAGELASQHKEAIVFVATKDYQDEILMQLEQLNFNRGQIIHIPQSKIMYTDETLLLPKGREVFIDCGCYDGTSSIEFWKWCHGNGMIYAFEPDRKNIESCRKNLNTIGESNYCLIEKGVWSEETVLRFKANSESTSQLCEEGDTEVAVINIDSVVKEEDKITFIKMDIEGAELEALKGAVNTIKRDRPRLAISVYHKMEDILDIPAFIKSIVPEYKLYLRSYVPIDTETVLYAICE